MTTPVTPAIVADLAPTGVLRASVNLGNPVLAQGTSSAPRGVTVDLAREIARRLGVRVELACFDAAQASFEALTTGVADLGFMAIEPARADRVHFTAPYVLIEGVYAVRSESPFGSPADVDRDGVRIGVKEGSAYDLFLTRTLRAATIVRGREGVEVFLDEELEVGAGIRQPLSAAVADRPDVRLVDEAFMQIRQAVCVPSDRQAASAAWLGSVVEQLRSSGFVADALERSGQGDVTVAPPA
ncbi:MAG: transporter substrate-binding domain-containing protein [Terracoccus sp.]